MSENNLIVYVYCDKVRSIHNVGSIFRTSEGFGFVKKIYLGGYTPTPEHPKMQKTALGAELAIDWETIKQPVRLINKLKSEGFQIIALEKLKENKLEKLKAKNKKLKIFSIYNFIPKNKVLFIVGNEIDGVSKNILENIDAMIEIPMNGKVKESLNVSVSFGIGLYSLIK
ncbi:MAG: TrmH family RNA methyltransferase [Patescibacteria group bacterium]